LYNLTADLPKPLPPVLHPGTLKPLGADDLAPLFPMSLIMQEVSTEREIEIPEPVRDVYRQWRVTPLYRARRLEKALQTPARIYYKYEGVSPAGSHKPNTAVAQAFYNKEAGIRRSQPKPVLVSGVRRWHLPVRCSHRRAGVHGARVVQPEAVSACVDGDLRRTLHRQSVQRDPVRPQRSGKNAAEQRQPRHRDFGAVEVAASRDDTKYALGSVLNHVLLHQTVIGQEAMAQLELAGDYPTSSSAAPAAVQTSPASCFRSWAASCAAAPRCASSRSNRRVPQLDARSLRLRLRRHRPHDAARQDAHARLVIHATGVHAGGLRYHGMAPCIAHQEPRAHRSARVSADRGL